MIQVENLKVSRGGRQVLEDVTFSVSQGQVLGLLGRNGAGKTTTLKVLCGLLKADEGKVNIAWPDGGFNATRRSQRLGCLIETPGFYPNLTASENLLLFSRDRSRQVRADIERSISLLGLNDANGKVVGKYSLGMKQRLGIARAILGHPGLVILDEPINGLDPHGILDIRELIRNLSRNHGTTFIVSSHILSEIEMIADVVTVIEEGKTVASVDLASPTTEEEREVVIEVDRTESAAMQIRKKWPGSFCEIVGENRICVTNFAAGADINRYLVELGHSVSALIPQTRSLESRVMKYMKRGV